MTTNIATYLKFANLQLASEALLDRVSDLNNAQLLADGLKFGNNHSSRFSTADAKDFSDNWTVVSHQANTSTGFSGTLFKYTGETDAAKGVTKGELVMSFRSTEFLDDNARDNKATNEMEVKAYGWAFGQISDMEDWYAKLKADPAKLGNSSFNVTGYSLGGHLATTCASRWHAVAKCIKLSIRYRNNSCLRNIYKFYSPKT